MWKVDESVEIRLMGDLPLLHMWDSVLEFKMHPLRYLFLLYKIIFRPGSTLAISHFKNTI